MELFMIGIDHRCAPLEVREKLTFCENCLPEAYAALAARDPVLECVILSTCNRVEIYALLGESRPSALKDFIRDFHNYDGPLDQYLCEAVGEAAVQHLCRVAAGIESMVFGESQIFGQVKKAYRIAELSGTVGRALSGLFPQIFSTVKRVRAKTKIGQYHVSIGSVAVAQAKSIFTNLSDTQVMVIGAGEIGELTARSLKASGSREIFVANRTFQKAVEVSEVVGGTPVMFHELCEYFRYVNIIINAVGTSGYVISSVMLREVVAMRKYSKLLIIDIAVPRGVDPGAADIEGVKLLNIDDLQEMADMGASWRACETEKAQTIIAERSARIMEKIYSCDLIPTFVYLRQKAEEIRRDGLDRIIPKLSVSKLDLEEIESLTKSIINRILYHSEAKMREYSKYLKQ